MYGQLSDLIAASGAAPQWVARWTDAGVLHAVNHRRGSGRHRLYDKSEIFLSVALSDFTHLGFKTSEVIRMAEALRACSELWKEPPSESTRLLLLGRRPDGAYDVGAKLGNIDDDDAELLGINSLRGYRPLIIVDIGEIWRCVFSAVGN